jgi:protein-S-isoprenylcysteine O-methyltransferase Ste14
MFGTRDFAAKGHGTPAPYDDPKKLAINGLYHFVRKPMYVGVVFALLGEAICFEAHLFRSDHSCSLRRRRVARLSFDCVIL